MRTAMRERLDAEKGQTTAVVLIFPALLLTVFLVVQFALAFHAKSVATAAAQEGVRAAQVDGVDAETGRSVARNFVEAHGRTLLRDVSVSLDADVDDVRAVVRGDVVSVVPGLTLHVVGRAGGPIERFRPETERR